MQLRFAHLEDPLPEGPFDVVVSVLAVHHLDGVGKAELFRRAADSLTPNGRIVLGDFVVPEDPSDLVTTLEPGYDTPSSISDQLHWLTAAGLQARVAWAHRDLAVLVGHAPSGPPPGMTAATGGSADGDVDSYRDHVGRESMLSRGKK